MDLDQTREAEIREAVERLRRLIPRDGAHVAIGAEAGDRTMAGSRLGYLRLGVEFLTAALQPLPATEMEPARVEPDLGYLLPAGARAPFDLCEVDESIGSRAPVRSGLGALGELFIALIAVAALIAVFVAGAFVVGWLFG